MAANADDGIVQIHGKDYRTVANRIANFREDKQDYTVETQLIFQDSDKVIMKALILDGEKLISTGYAEEDRVASAVNKTSALENAETSAVGRALAFYGLAGTDIATESDIAVAQAKQQEFYLIEYNELVRLHWDSINETKTFLRPIYGDNEDQMNVSAAREAFNEIPEDDRKKLWRAPTKGGCLTTQERDVLKTKPEDAL